jgi:hypothetical protein
MLSVLKEIVRQAIWLYPISWTLSWFAHLLIASDGFYSLRKPFPGTTQAKVSPLILPSYPRGVNQAKT